jgi:hypothetical protein
MDLVEAHAVLHQESRERDNGRIVATLDDYAAVHDLIAGIVGEASEVTVSETVRKTVGMVRDLISEDKEVTRNTLAERLGIVPTSAGRRFAPATAAGYVKEDPDNPNEKPKRYVLGNVPLPENVEVIPSPETLRSCVSASGAEGGGVSAYNRASEDFGNARSDASVHARSSDSVSSTTLEDDRYEESRDNGAHGETATRVSQIPTHARTIFADEPEVAENPRTVHATVRNIVRPGQMDSDQLRGLVRGLIDRYPFSPYSILWQASGLSHDRADWETFVSLVIEEREAAA